jgi:class 3 adenylate cyclase/tetratricopeptide (TPR) repeat protein
LEAAEQTSGLQESDGLAAGAGPAAGIFPKMGNCSSCGAENRPGGRFCAQCGTALTLQCPTCGAANGPGDRFCVQCGTALNGSSAPPAVPAEPTTSVAERRLVSVLFADLVGFTTLSEHRDPEELRELLSAYFERCRSIIERYGGTVEKFIGDAVMAVWGTPVAREDDAERAVRAALSLTQAVTALGEEAGMSGLRVRAGVLTGSAAVEVGADGEGMVLGDTVNTASRLQSIAAPGTVLVDDVTRRSSEAAIAYEDAGTHQVKGRDQPVHAFIALRVVAGAGGARRGAGLEAPFVGRDAELQAVIDAGETSAAEGCAQHVAVVGDAGSGKSRLLWEYFKYIDGIEEVRWWHQGRCLSYGEGVAYWALAEMIRSRAGIVEEEAPAAAREKLRAAVAEHVPDERERRLVEPRLAHLLRLDERPDADRADLFSGWRLFFERMAQSGPVILIFEDMQWADSGLLEFIDYLLDWSADHPIFVLTLARPELRERRPSWQPLPLAPLLPQAIATILEGLAPGISDDLVADIVGRADGIPLYAVEFIRMLQDRGVLVQDGARYVVAGDVRELDIPETLHALVASRLDGLASDQRSLLQDASVLGHSFPAAGAAALSGRPEHEVVQILEALVAKQMLARDDDPRSPERGQYVFLQELVRSVAYGTLSRRARKGRHVAAARHLEQTWPGEVADIAEVLAAHHLAAIAADPDADDVAVLRASARRALADAGRAAASLALGPEALRYFEQAAELAETDEERALLFEQAGRALWHSGDVSAAEAWLRSAMELYERSGRAWGGTAVVALADVLRMSGRAEEARPLLERFRSADEADIDPVVRADGLRLLAATLVHLGALDECRPLLDEALTILEAEQAWPELATGLLGQGVYLLWCQRREEGSAVLQHALRLAQQHDLPTVALRVHFNLAGLWLDSDRLVDAVEEVNAGLVLARERGDRANERELLAQLLPALALLGRWDEAMPVATAVFEGAHDTSAGEAAMVLAQIAAGRGDDAMLERCRALGNELSESAEVDVHALATVTLARAALESGAPEEALRLARAALASGSTAGELLAEAYAIGVEAALGLGNEAPAAELGEFVDRLPPATATPLLRAGRARLAAELAHRRGDAESADAHEREAIELLRALGARPLLARALEERGRRREDADALAEARAIYSELGATRWLASIDERSEVPA